MNINRHNYEEFFLLYVDNELSAQERSAVELFTQQNPDLGKELQLLQQSIVSQDEIVFEDKQSLLKDGSLALQEKLMLFADDELSLEEKTKMFALLETDNAVAAEWKILQQAKLQPDESIVFVDKRSLYRREGGRVIATRWWRVAAAAVLLGFGIWVGTNLFGTGKKTGGSETESIANNKTVQSKQNTNTVEPTQVQPMVKQDSANEIANTVLPQKDQQQIAPRKNNLVSTNDKNNNPVKDKLIKQKEIRQKDNNNSMVKEDVQNKKPGNNLPKPNLENLNNIGSNKEAVVIVQPKTQDNNLPRPAENKTALVSNTKSNEPVKNSDNNNTAATNNIAKNAVYNETDENNGDNKILYMDEDKVKRSKIGGFLRRLTRVVERTTNIKTGKSVKVAGFEIAIK